MNSWDIRKEEAPTIGIVENLLREALQVAASDIHIEPSEEYVRVRYRVDGTLIDQTSIALELGLQVIARIKVLAHLDVAEKRIPQDGKFCIPAAHGRVDLRIATFPSLYGEKVVIRILDRFTQLLDISHLGFEDHIQKQLEQLLACSQGFFLVTGPTGSGKTTTLYAALSHLHSPHRNIITLEDPVEYNIDGITQGQVYPEVGFTFAKGIRALLRQDPDIIMVGEIRDRETAEVAIQAALTGHLVLSTLHTNDAPGTILRLLDMGIPAFLINSCLNAVIAQRLIRKLCASCSIQEEATQGEREVLASLGVHVTHIRKPQGCKLCNGLGYKGRAGIFEFLNFSTPLQALITSNPSYMLLRNQAIAEGMIPLEVDAAIKVKQGITSLEEFIRIKISNSSYATAS